MKDFEPRPFQQGVFKELTKKQLREMPFPPMRGRMYYGVDLSRENGDKSVIFGAKMDNKGRIVAMHIDEYTNMPDYKWYRNPIKWWKWRRLIKGITRKEWIGKWKS
jgi:hypothetical protein